MNCPVCDAELDLDEYDVDKGDVVSCSECGANLEVVNDSPLELEAVDEDEEADDEDDDLEDDDLEDEDEEDEDEEDEDWDE
jgi:alpha-aminoadipate/glutamate carrier protein LysW